MNIHISPTSLAVMAAERDYANAICEREGTTQADADLDIMHMAATADWIASLSRRAWANRPTSDTASCVEYVPVEVASELAEFLAEKLGLSDHAARLLDAQVQRAIS